MTVDELDRPGVDPPLLVPAPTLCASLHNPGPRGAERARGVLRVLLYDVFPDGASGGNVAGVVLDASGLNSAEMQRIASELNAPTTGFEVDNQDRHTPAFAIRYFTPREEIGLCGHVAVATFTALVEESRCKLQDEGTRVL